MKICEKSLIQLKEKEKHFGVVILTLNHPSLAEEEEEEEEEEKL